MNPFQALIYAAIFAGGVAFAGAGGQLWDNWIDDPAIVREQHAICVATTVQISTQKQLEEYTRQREIADAARRQFELDLGRAKAAQAITKDQLDAQIAAFEAAGPSKCHVSVDNIDFLRPDARPPAGPGR